MKKIKTFSIFAVFFVVVFVSFFMPRKYEKTIFAMDTVINFEIKGTKKQVRDIEEIITNADKKYSAYNQNSEVYKLNRNKKLKTEDITLYKNALYFSEITNGAFDLTLMPISRLWGITSENPKVPSDTEIKEELKKVSYKNLSINNNEISLANNAEIDLGGIIKGYTGDEIRNYVKKNNISYAVVDLGGNIYVFGKNKEMKVGIQEPFKQRGEVLFTVSVNDKSIVSSGTYERNFEKDGKIYHHIFNPKTGKPTENQISEVTVIGENGTLCDALSTAITVMGEKEAYRLYESRGDFEYVIVKGKDVFVSKGLKIENLKSGYRRKNANDY